MENTMQKIIIDGSLGEGGGQILRTALSLSMITGTPFAIENIRAGRKKPGLLAQHLVAVKAATAISNAVTIGTEKGSTALNFVPGPIVGGEYAFDIGSAGSATLVLQTILPALLFAKTRSRVTITGGTHNPMAPPAHFIEHSFRPLLARMGANFDIELQRYGFYPAGGGRIVADIEPSAGLKPLILNYPGAVVKITAIAVNAGVPESVAQRELATLAKVLGIAASDCSISDVGADQGPGNALLVTVEREHVTEVFCAIAERGVRAEDVAKGVARDVLFYLATDTGAAYSNSCAAVAENLADQLLLPIALAGAGSFTTSAISEHTRTNARVIEMFLPVKFRIDEKTQGLHVVSLGGV
jgi:RNA 3'-terminal phosphate cyclase (ATP)